MTTIGDLTGAATPYVLRSGAVIVGEPFALDELGLVTSVAAKISGDGTAAGDGELHGAIYTEAGVLVTAGPVSVVEDDQAAGITRLGFEGALRRMLQPGTYRVALLADSDSTLRLWTDAAHPTPRPATIVGAAPPSGPYVRWVGGTDTLTIEVEETGAGAAGDAALFVQPSAPAASGRRVWVQRGRDIAESLSVWIETTGTGTPADDSDVARSIGGATSRALHALDVTGDGDSLQITARYAPEELSTFPDRLDGDNHYVSAPFVVELAAPFKLPANVSDDYLAALPWDLAQRALSETGPLRDTRRQTRASWFGQPFAQGRSAEAIVRSGSALAAFVGERIRVSYRRRGKLVTVALAVVDEREFQDGVDEDLLMTHRAWIALGASPAAGSIAVQVEQLA